MLKRYFAILALTILFSSYTKNSYQTKQSRITNEALVQLSSLSPEQKKQIQLIDSRIISIYNILQKQENIDFDVFKTAFIGFEEIKKKKLLKNDSLLSIVDFSKPSSEKRFFTIDLKNKEIIYKEFVAHGINSGILYAENFSNAPGSQKSSLGFYITNETYIGSNGFSLKLDGLESGINDNARIRGIVIHGANYADSIFLIQNNNRLGRSFGCPALPMNSYVEIIETIKNKSCLFIYAPEKKYFEKSAFINQINRFYQNS